MTHDEVQARLQTVFRDVFRDTELILTSSMSAWDISGWDSIANMQLMLAVESEFQIRMRPAEVVKLKCVGDLITLVQSRLSI